MPQRLDVVGAPKPVLAELVHPGPGEGFVGPHRRVEGGLLTEDGALLLLPGLFAAVAARPHLWLAHRTAPGQLTLSSWQAGSLRALRTLTCSGLHLGGEWLVAWRGTRAWAEHVATGQPVGLPLGALEARARPWRAGAGASWILGRSVIEQAGDQRPRSVGVADEALRGLVAGPGGAVVARGAEAAWVRAPGHGLRSCELDGLPGEVAFSPDGRQALVEEEDGVALVDLASGQVEGRRAEGRPAGFGWWVDPAGQRLRWRVEASTTGLPGPGVLHGGALHGPGGLAWDLRTGQPRGNAATQGADLATSWGSVLLMVEHDRVLLGETEELFTLPEDEAALQVLACGPLAAVRTPGGVAWGGRDADSWRWSPLPLPASEPLLACRDGVLLVGAEEGPRRLPDLAAAPGPLPSPGLPDLAADLGLPLDGAVIAPDGSTWAWQDDGPLLRLRATRA